MKLQEQAFVEKMLKILLIVVSPYSLSSAQQYTQTHVDSDSSLKGPRYGYYLKGKV